MQANDASIEYDNGYLKKSDRLKIEDLDWSQCEKTELSANESYLLDYFADVEGQVFFYARDLMNTSSVRSEEVRNFLTIWSYQEHFHSVALRRFLKESSKEILENRDQVLRKKTSFAEILTDFAGLVFSKLFSKDYLALYLTWGAINEAMTMRGYTEIAQSTQNPVLAELCRRIAKQEAFHFGWYYSKAKEQLAKSSRTQRMVRFLLSSVWTPVGVGVKTREEFNKIMKILFEGRSKKEEMIVFIDNSIHQLPGLSNLNLFAKYSQNS